VIVISDTSPICYLVLIDAIDLLPQLYEEVIIPEAVCIELGASASPTILREWINNPPSWLIVQSVETINDESLSSLDLGERNVIFLAEKLKADLVVLDEQEGRKIAASKNLKVIGLLGILYQAAIRDLIDLEEYVERLRKTNFRASSGLFNSLLIRYHNQVKNRDL
jgi:predicted nucleic acid-binding protein